MSESQPDRPNYELPLDNHYVAYQDLLKDLTSQFDHFNTHRQPHSYLVQLQDQLETWLDMVSAKINENNEFHEKQLEKQLEELRADVARTNHWRNRLIVPEGAPSEKE